MKITRKAFLAGAVVPAAAMNEQHPQQDAWIRFTSVLEPGDVRLRVSEIEFWLEQTDKNWDVYRGGETYTVATHGPIVNVCTKTAMPFTLIGDEAKRFMRLMEGCE